MGSRYKIHRLVLGVALLSAALTLDAAAQAPAANSELEGSSWQLVRIEGSDGKIHAPQDRSRYMLAYHEPDASPGTFRHITVTLDDAARKRYPGAELHSRSGYYAE